MSKTSLWNLWTAINGAIRSVCEALAEAEDFILDGHVAQGDAAEAIGAWMRAGGTLGTLNHTEKARNSAVYWAWPGRSRQS